MSRVKPHGDGRVDAGGRNAEPLGDLVSQGDAVFPVDPEQRSTVRKNLGTRPVVQHIFNDPFHHGLVLVAKLTVAGEIDDMLAFCLAQQRIGAPAQARSPATAVVAAWGWRRVRAPLSRSRVLVHQLVMPPLLELVGGAFDHVAVLVGDRIAGDEAHLAEPRRARSRARSTPP